MADLEYLQDQITSLASDANRYRGSYGALLETACERILYYRSRFEEFLEEWTAIADSLDEEERTLENEENEEERDKTETTIEELRREHAELEQKLTALHAHTFEMENAIYDPK